MPEPFTPHPTPQTSTLPQPPTLNPQPSTLNPQQAWELSPDGNNGARGGAYHDVCEAECAQLCGGSNGSNAENGSNSRGASRGRPEAEGSIEVATGGAMARAAGKGSSGPRRARSAALI